MLLFSVVFFYEKKIISFEGWYFSSGICQLGANMFKVFPTEKADALNRKNAVLTTLLRSFCQESEEEMYFFQNFFLSRIVPLAN